MSKNPKNDIDEWAAKDRRSALDRALEILGMDTLSYKDIAKEATAELARTKIQLADALSNLSECRDIIKTRDQALACNDDLAKMNAQLSKNLKASLQENSQLTDYLYAEAKRSVKALELIQRVVYAIGTDTIDRLDYKPYLEWVEDFPKPPALCEHGNKPEKCAHCHPRWD